MEHSTITFHTQRRLGIWQKLGGTSLMIAIIVHIIALIAGAIWIFQIVLPKPDPNFISGRRGESGQTHEKTNIKKTRQISSDVRRVIIESPEAPCVIPDIAGEFGQLTGLVSMNDGGFTGGLGDRNGSQLARSATVPSGISGMSELNAFKMVPMDMGKRCSKSDRIQRLKENGGTEACETAVINGLRWLKTNQNADGSFADGNHKIAMTGLALLAYFGHCETPASEEFGDSCTRGIVFLVQQGMKNDGKMASDFTSNAWCYEHAIATYALGEAYTFCKEFKQNQFEIPGLEEITQKAGQFIIDHQNDNGGWAYAYARKSGHTDVSVAGWQMQALKACSLSGILYQGMTTTIIRGLKYLNHCQDPSGGFGYTNTAASGGLNYHTLTGVGMLCNQIWGRENSSEVRKAAKYVLKNTRFEYHSEFSDLYGHYYESQAMMRRGGESWKQYNDLFRDQLLHNQDADGSWKTPGGGKKLRAVAPEYVSNKVYRTCLCILMLEVYYRFLSTDGGTYPRPLQ